VEGAPLAGQHCRNAAIHATNDYGEKSLTWAPVDGGGGLVSLPPSSKGRGLLKQCLALIDTERKNDKCGLW
jgi:hypothetical protein